MASKTPPSHPRIPQSSTPPPSSGKNLLDRNEEKRKKKRMESCAALPLLPLISGVYLLSTGIVAVEEISTTRHQIYKYKVTGQRTSKPWQAPQVQLRKEGGPFFPPHSISGSKKEKDGGVCSERENHGGNIPHRSTTIDNSKKKRLSEGDFHSFLRQISKEMVF